MLCIICIVRTVIYSLYMYIIVCVRVRVRVRVRVSVRVCVCVCLCTYVNIYIILSTVYYIIIHNLYIHIILLYTSSKYYDQLNGYY